MSFQEFLRGVAAGEAPPACLSPALLSLWWSGRGDWARAHALAQEHEDEAYCDLVHAHLHRQEGDVGNARYWYRLAGRPMPTTAFREEWESLVAELLSLSR